jgi:ABC-type multidrug transport system ATPase subunit
MKKCPACSADQAAGSKFCRQCGAALPEFEATVAMTATMIRRAPVRQAFDIKALLARREKLVIGRAADCDIRLDHPSVSRYHARVEMVDGSVLVSDLSSVNGVTVGGVRAAEPTRLKEGDKVGIGPYLLTLSAGVLQSLDSSRSLRLEARGLEKAVLVPGGTRKIIEDINLAVLPGEFVALLGPSGCGKSTLMDCLNGRRPATGGLVLANGENFYRHYDSFRQSLGYVPQKDIVHADLTVRSALRYTARLRLPMDTAPKEIEERLEDVLRKMDLLAHRDTRVGSLSGGQIKRVSLGAELVGQPALLYIDEATSGLDAGTERRMMRLFNDLSQEGRSLICITHNVDNVDQCHLALILARGKLVYYGPPREATRWFKVPRISDIYDRLSERDIEAWHSDFKSSELYQEFVRGRLEARPTKEAGPSAPVINLPLPPEEKAPELPPQADTRSVPNLADRFRALGDATLRLRERLRPALESWHQLKALTSRYVELILGDTRSLRLMLLQAPLVAAILLLGFLGKPFHRSMPLLRPITDEERQTLLALRGLSQMLDGNRPLTDEQRQALSRLEVEVSGLPVPVNGVQLAQLLRKLRAGELTEKQEAMLRSTRIALEVDGAPLEVTAADAAAAWRRIESARLPEQLLRIEGPVVPEKPWFDPRYSYILLFILSVVVLWFGCNNASREIVKEEAIFSRERAVNLRILPYLASKVLVLSVITAAQVALLLLLIYGPMEVLARINPAFTTSPPQLMLGYGWQLAVFTLLGVVGVAMGLFLSACVTSADRANALLPYVLIPQMILGGGFITVSGLLFWLAALFCPVYWAFRAVRLGADVLPPGFPGYSPDGDGIAWPCLALAAQGAALLLLTYIVLRRREA